jgi:predicted DNA-binding transcriptional regulator YafY
MGLADHSNFSRALDMVCRLQSGERMDARKIADTYGVCMRTAYRLMIMAEMALPVRRIGGQGLGQSFLVWIKEPK